MFQSLVQRKSMSYTECFLKQLIYEPASSLVHLDGKKLWFSLCFRQPQERGGLSQFG